MSREDKKAAIEALEQQRAKFDAAIKMIAEAPDEVVAVLKAAWSSNGNGHSTITVPRETKVTFKSAAEWTGKPWGRLTDEVERRVILISDEFNVVDIYSAMAADGYQFQTKTPKISVADVLRKLKERGEIEQIRAGHGSTPTTYKRKQ